MPKLNCWEFKRCGREPQGTQTGDLSICRASTETNVDGINGGYNGGRACWAIAGTLCGGEVQGTFATKLQNCIVCDFYALVKEEEGERFSTSREILPLVR